MMRCFDRRPSVGVTRQVQIADEACYRCSMPAEFSAAQWVHPSKAHSMRNCHD